MRRSLISQAVEEAEEPNITPMLDVVLFFLFFIVTANFIKIRVLELIDLIQKRPRLNALFYLLDQLVKFIWMEEELMSSGQANVIRLMAENPQGAVVMQADEKATAEKIIAVMDEVREAGVIDISIASEPNF